MYKKLFVKIKQNEKIAIYGTNKTAENIYEQIAKLRPDIQICFFISSKKDNRMLKGLNIYSLEELEDKISTIDNVIIASYSARHLLKLAIQTFGIKKPILINKKMIISEKTINNKPDIDLLNKSLKIFKNYKDKNLYNFIAKARSNRKKYIDKIKKRFNSKYKNIIEIYPIEHYFEFINKNAIKTVIDGGAYDGLHSVMFTQEFPNCQKVYMFEPSYNAFKNNLIDFLIQKDQRISLIEKALWNESKILEFREEFECKTGSSIVEVKPNIKRPSKIIKIPALKIDDFVQKIEEKIDFIKLDIENAELQALEGAINTIKKDRPQLAVSIYHSDDQFYNVPLFLYNNLDNYVYHVGHYSDSYVETVLYAIPKELT